MTRHCHHLLSVLCLGLFVVAGSLRAAITYDQKGSGLASNVTSISFSHVLGSGSNRLLVVAVATEDSIAANSVISGVTFNGAAMTLVSSSRISSTVGAGTNESAIFYLLNASLPAAGTYTVVVTTAGASDIIGHSLSFFGVRQQVAEAVATGTSTASTISTSITTVTTGAWVVDVLSNAGLNSNFTATNGDMVERSDVVSPGHSSASATKATTTAGSTPMSWSHPQSGRETHSLAAFAEVPTLTGTVFEDVNYSGGAGRSNATASGSPRSGARVELFSAAGAYISATTTDGSGNYSFTVSTSTSYIVRVVNSTVTSSLGGTSLIPVQTYRTTATSGSAVGVTDRVGGEDPGKADAGNGSTTLAALTAGSLTPQSITSVTVGSNSVAGLDFGFNFCAIVNTTDSGQGSLRQFMTNTNGMAGSQTSVFMITDGSAHAGLRSGLTNQLTSGVAVITAATALPSLSGITIVDGTSQTANIGNTNSGTLGTGGTAGVDAVTLSTVNRPEVEIVGSSSIAHGLRFLAASSTAKGLAIHGFGSSLTTSDIRFDGVSGSTVTECVIGTTATSFTVPASTPTGGCGLYTDAVTSASFTNNVIGFTAYAGIYINNTSASSCTVQNNEVRGCGTANPGVGGIEILGTSHTVTGNLAAANKGEGIDIYTSTGGSNSLTNNTLTGNGVGTSYVGESPALRINNSSNTVSRNRIYSNYGAAILNGPSGTGNRYTQNSFYSNGTILAANGAAASGEIGIDLQATGENNSIGTSPFYTLNDSGDADTGGNNLLNAPVLEYASIYGASLIITGWARPGSILELFISDSDPSGFGEGQTYLASVTEGGGSDNDATSSSYSGTLNGVAQGSDTTNRFSFVIALPGGVSTGTKLTATATDASNNTSEFSGQVTAATLAISGNVFEDHTYTGGAGRTKAAASGASRPGARVELYDASGNYLSAATTDASGDYTFTAVTPSTSYTTRVVNSSVTSSLGGTSLLPVQTYRTTATSGTAAAITDRVGGEDPSKADAGNGSTTLAALTAGSLTPQSITSVALGVTPLTGVDFGFNFNTVVNTSDSGQGSLRQFITNANGLTGTQTSVFMITDGSAHAGLRAGLTNQLTSGVAIITPATALPQITGTLTLDATTQTTHIGDTNSGTLGTGGTVGVDGLTLSTVNRPEVELVGSAGAYNGLDVTAASVTIKGLAIHGFSNSGSYADIYFESGANTGTVTQCVIGSTATAFTLPGSNTSGGSGINLASTSGSITNNLIGFTDYNAINVSTGGTGWTVQNNEIRGAGRASAQFGGFDLQASGTTITGNLIAACGGNGTDTSGSGSGTTYTNNTLSANGAGTGGTPETAGMRVRAGSSTIDRNIITANHGAGVMVTTGVGGVKITRNSIYTNGATTGQIGIDLLATGDDSSAGTAPYHTLNDATDADSGGNTLLNYPVLDTATIVGTNLELTGWVASGAIVEFFISDGDASSFGEGQTYIGSVVEGGGSDTDATSSSYSGNVNCFAQGSDTTVPRFKYTFALPGGITPGTTKLTATATDASNNTSEFSGQVTVYTVFPSFTVVKSSQAYSDPLNATTNPKAIPGGFILYSAVATNTYPARNDTGTFILTDPIPTDTELFVGDLGGAGSGPVSFTDGATASALTYTFISLASTTDDVAFSNDGGTTWTYTPTPDVNGCDATITHLRINPKGAFNRSACGNNPSCTLAFRVRVK